MGHPDGKFFVDGVDFDEAVQLQFERYRPLSIQGTPEQVMAVMSDLMKAGAEFVGAIIEYEDDDFVEPTDEELFSNIDVSEIDEDALPVAPRNQVDLRKMQEDVERGYN